MNTDNRTVLHADFQGGAPDPDIRFSQRKAISPQMAAGCESAVKADLLGRTERFDFGFPQPVLVSLDQYLHGRVGEAIGLVAYKGKSIDTLFFVYKDKAGILRAIMGNSRDISHALDGWMEYQRYYAMARDPITHSWLEIFPVSDFKTLWIDEDGEIAGADCECNVVSLSKEFTYKSYDRVPSSILIRIHASVVQGREQMANAKAAYV